MFPATLDPTSPFHILAPAYNPLIEPCACGAGVREHCVVLGLPRWGMLQGRTAASMKPCSRTMNGLPPRHADSGAERGDATLLAARRTPMKPFQTILFGADFSEGSREAFRAACSLAVAGQTRIHVLHVIEPNWVPEEPVPFGQAVVGFYDAPTDGGRYEIPDRRMREMYAPNLPVDVEYHIREGDAAGEILRMAGQLRPDLIVVGTHGRTGLSWLLAGSVATSVVRRANARCWPSIARSARAMSRTSGSSCTRPISRRAARTASGSPARSRGTSGPGSSCSMSCRTASMPMR